MLSLKKIRKTYSRVVAVDDLSLEIRTGEFCVLLGPSGCGKTTLLRLIAGLETKTAGEIWMDGVEVTSKPPFQRPIGMVFQSYALFPHLTVYKNIAYGLEILKKSRKEVEAAVRSIAETLHIVPLLDRQVHQISGGQQQRVALARALIMKPKLLLFDEPLSNLDAKLRRKVRDEIKQIHEQFQITSVYVTHDQTEALTLADQIVLMHEGKIVQRGTPREMYEDPKNEFSAQFLGEANLVSENGKTRFIRPENVILSRLGHGYRGKIKKKAYLGSVYEYTLATDFGEIFAVDRQMQEEFQVGEEVLLNFSSSYNRRS